MPSAPKTTIQLGPLRIDFLVEAGDSNGTVTMFECTVPAGSMVPPAHSHDGFEETAYVLEGTCTWTIDGATGESGPGESVCIRRGQVHGFENRGDQDLRILAIATPGVFGPTYFQEVAGVIATAAGGPPDPAAIGAVMRRHGLTPALPAMSTTA
ncbi:MAG TPA: cupin domain-containing protein [Solirubrobacteraceae bacterium]|nr:cupin domain-containing protein [Solirubrobacteraceae bacterium]